MAQEVIIDVNNMALNKVLIEIRDRYDLNLSFDDKELSNYNLTIHQRFSNPDEAFQFILKDIPVSLEKTSNVYLFLPKVSTVTAPRNFQLSGKILDYNTKESLPFTHLQINNTWCIADEYGNFNFQSTQDSIFYLFVSHLGYSVLDTAIQYGFNHKILLISKSLKLYEVLVLAKINSFSEQTGRKAGLMRINHKLALLIPGNGDNSVFNLLRLQPGIMASGDQSSEMIIWGSYAGQSQVNFDGMTIFGLKNYTDNISAVNPYMAKDIRVFKGGYDAPFGERVGGIVDITGIEGNREKAGFNLNLNNNTMNVLAETPVGRNMTLVGAYRQTYYNLYSPNDINVKESTQNHFSGSNIVVNPTYQFRDGNLKLSGRTSTGDSYYLSSFWGQDNFSYMVDQIHSNSIIEQKIAEKNSQYGLVANYNWLWEGWGNLAINMAYSGLESYESDVQKSSRTKMEHVMHNSNQQIQNNISELKTEVSGKLRWKPLHEIEYGIGLIHNAIFLEETFDATSDKTSDEGAQVMSFIQDRISPIKQIDLTIGLRNDYSLNDKKVYPQPRISLAVKPTPNIQFNTSWGIYNQFIVLSSEVDPNENYRYLWRVSDGIKIPVLKSQHFVFGGVYNDHGFSMSVEGFYKATKGLTRFIQKEGKSTLYQGNSVNRGVDLFIKQEYRGHKGWISYSLSNALEWFPFFQDTNFKSALHDQRHELKLAGIINISPFNISTNYVYGSGYIQSADITANEKYPYHRFDLAGIYRLQYKRIKMETGISILNIFNYKNLSYTNITQIPTDSEGVVSIYTEAVPFTLSIFLNISL